MDSRHPVRHARNLCTCMFLEFRADAMHHCAPVRLPDQPSWVHVNASVEMCVRGTLIDKTACIGRVCCHQCHVHWRVKNEPAMCTADWPGSHEHEHSHM